MKKKTKTPPSFASEAAERTFWQTHELVALCRLEQGKARALSKS